MQLELPSGQVQGAWTIVGRRDGRRSKPEFEGGEIRTSLGSDLEERARTLQVDRGYGEYHAAIQGEELAFERDRASTCRHGADACVGADDDGVGIGRHRAGCPSRGVVEREYPAL